MLKNISRGLLMFVAIFAVGCGGGGGTGAGGDTTDNPSIDVPNAPTGDDGSGTGGDESGEDTGGSVLPETPQRVLIKGSLIDAEGTGIANATITFHSTPVTVVTDALGIFEALLEIGDHTFEVTGDTTGNISGTITVNASGAVDDAGQAIGTFVANVTSAVGEGVACAALRLADIISTGGVATGQGIWSGTFGDEIGAQGNNLTAMITGNSEMVVNVSLDGRVNGLWFPTVGAFNHVPYLSGVADWVKPFQGSFGGIKRGENYYWFTDSDYWDAPTIQYQSGTFAPIVEITHTGKSDCSGATIKEKLYVVHDAYAVGGGRTNVLIRDVQMTAPTLLNNLCKTTANAAFAPHLVLYSRYNPNATYQLFRQWKPEVAGLDCADNRMYWAQLVAPQNTIVMEAIDSTRARQTLSCTNVTTLHDAQKIDSVATCFPLSVIGTIADWQMPATKRIYVATAGCGLSGAPCYSALTNVETGILGLETTLKSQWNSWLSGVDTTTITDSTWLNRYKRWLVSMKMLADKNTGAIIAAPSQEPTYYYSWPRDGVFQAIAYIMAGKYAEAASFFTYLFNMAQNWDNGWTQAHSSLDGSNLALPASPLRVSIEEDQPPTVLWGLWVYWRTKSPHALPTGISTSDIKEVANYVMSKICLSNGLLMPSLDWHENPYKDLGQSLYTNAAAYAGLLAAAEMVESSDSAAATTYRNAAHSIKNAVETRLCPGGSCHSRIKYDFAYLGDLGDPLRACNRCLTAPFSDTEGELTMAFEWPFHIFDLDDARVQSYYDKTWNTFDDLSEFSQCKPLWIPRYLFSYLFAREGSANSEVAAGSFKSRLSSNATAIETNFPDIMTDSGYLMDQYIDGEEGDVFGDEYSGARLGSSARPLGWSQAMGVLTALAKYDRRVPMISKPVATDCEIGSGPCCDSAGHFKSISDSCSSTYDFNCPDGTACGSSVKRTPVTQYCSGTSASCTGTTVRGTPEPVQTCTSSQMCVVGNTTCQPCAGCASHDHQACYSGDLYWYNSCGARETGFTDCGTAGCSSGACCTTHASSSCSGGDVHWLSSCSVDEGVRTSCGTSGYGSNYCSGGNVYHDYVTRGCSSGSCTSSTPSPQLVQDCSGLGCTSGVCNTDCPIRTWPNNTLTAMDVGGGISLMWNPPSTGSWVDHYTIARRTGSDVPQEGDVIASTTDNSYIDRTPLRGSRYRYVVFAWRNCGPHGVGSTIATVDY